MKKTITISVLSLFLTIPAFASYVHCEMNLRIGGGMWHHLNDRQEATIKRIVERKGYILTENKKAPFQAHVSRGHGFVCGTGVSNYDLMFRVPAGYSINITGPGFEVKKREEFEGTGITVGARAFSKLKAELRDLPFCE
jgi:hypothetical protein